MILTLLVIASGFIVPIALGILRLGQEIAPARIDRIQELGRMDMPWATLEIRFTVQPFDREPFTWFFLRTVRRRRLARYAPGELMTVRFNPLDAVPTPRPVHFRRAGYFRPARLWLIRGFRPWILAALVAFAFALALASLGGDHSS